jgi:hypothetical protein
MSDTKETMLSNIEMNDVLAAFNRLDGFGKRVYYETYHQYPTSSSAELFRSHFKGIAAYKNKLVFTHTNLPVVGHFGNYPG